MISNDSLLFSIVYGIAKNALGDVCRCWSISRKIPRLLKNTQRTRWWWTRSRSWLVQELFRSDESEGEDVTWTKDFALVRLYFVWIKGIFKQTNLNWQNFVMFLIFKLFSGGRRCVLNYTSSVLNLSLSLSHKHTLHMIFIGYLIGWFSSWLWG